jgi:hypothetical protein
MLIRTSVLLSTALLFAGGAFAQTTAHIRKQDQQTRIAKGVHSGQLTAGEAKSLEGKQANLNRQIRDDRSANRGKLTAQEKKQINNRQNNLSKQIYADKHNANTAHYGNGVVGQRRAEQQARIANGIQSGKMTPGEASRVENREQGVNQQIWADHQANGGGALTRQQRAQINQQQNGTSQAIYNKKHNGQNGY